MSGPEPLPAARAAARAWSERAHRVLPGGVSTNVRLADGADVFIAERARGARIWDVAGAEYVDFVCGFGAVLLGYAHPAVQQAAREAIARGQQFGATHVTEILLAERLCALVPGLDMVRFSSTGSEAVQAAVRLARLVTGRHRIVKFEGHYHGWLDGMLVSTHPDPPAAPAGQSVAGILDSQGIPEAVLDALLVLPWNDVEAVEQALAVHGHDVAAVIMEPVMCNDGCIEPEGRFLEAVRALCHKHGALLIFDEVITGFRLALTGAQGVLGVRPDLSIFGKALGSGFPISLVGGPAVLMRHFGSGALNHSGTFNGNTVATASGLATLALLQEPAEDVYPGLHARGRRLITGLIDAGRSAGVRVHAQGPGPVFWMWIFPDSQPLGWEGGRIRHLVETAAADLQAYERFRTDMRRRGIRLMPGGRWYVSTAHTDADIDRTLQAAGDSLRELR